MNIRCTYCDGEISAAPGTQTATCPHCGKFVLVGEPPKPVEKESFLFKTAREFREKREMRKDQERLTRMQLDDRLAAGENGPLLEEMRKQTAALMHIRGWIIFFGVLTILALIGGCLRETRSF